MSTRRTLLLLAAALVLPITLHAAEAKVAWHFDIKENDEGTPRGKICLEVDGKRHIVSDTVTGNFSEVDKVNFKKKQIPADALTACRGTWAHLSKQFYAVSKDGKIQVFVREEDGEGGFVGKYKLVKTIP